MATAIETLKTYFENGKKPTEQEFAELIDAFVHRDDDLQIFAGELAEISEAEQGVLTDKYMTPLLTKFAIHALTRLADIPDLELEVDVKDDAVKAALRDGIASSLDTLNKLHIALTAAINTHAALSNNPHSVTKSQVGLGNPPNAKSDAITLNSSVTLATSKAVKTLNDNKEPVFGKNTAFNKNFGSGSNDIPRGNHTHTYLHYFSTEKVKAVSNGIEIKGLWAMTENGAGSNTSAIWNESGGTVVALQNIPGTQYFKFHTDGRILTPLGDVVTSGGNKTWDLIQSGNEFNFAGNGLTYTSCVVNYRGAGSGTGTSQTEDYYFCKGYATSTTTQLADINAKDLNYYGGINNPSDERLKRNIAPLAEGAKELIKQISPVLYLLHSLDDEGKTTPDRLGLIAQQVEMIIPQAVTTHKNGIKSIDYSKLVVPLIKAFQEQESELDTLKADVEAIKQQLNER